MNYNSIKELLEKFYAGETTLEEEATLRRFFAEKDIPEALRADQALFRSLTEMEEESLLNEDFDTAVLAQMEGNTLRWGRHQWVYTLSGLAAAAVVVISLWVGGVFAPQRQLPGTINNPQVAYAETKKALAEVSDNLNLGLVPVQRAAEKMDQPVQQVSTNIGNMQQALGRVQYLEQMNKARELMHSVNVVYSNLGIKITF